MDFRSPCLIIVMDTWAKCAFLRVVGGVVEHIYIYKWHIYIYIYVYVKTGISEHVNIYAM